MTTDTTDQYRYGQPVIFTAGPLSLYRDNECVEGATVSVGDRGTYIGPAPDPGDMPDWHLIGVKVDDESFIVPAAGMMFKAAASS